MRRNEVAVEVEYPREAFNTIKIDPARFSDHWKQPAREYCATSQNSARNQQISIIELPTVRPMIDYVLDLKDQRSAYSL